MKERPILFSGPMVLAILEGRKTQTRRVVKRTGKLAGYKLPDDLGGAVPSGSGVIKSDGVFFGPLPYPYGLPGDRLWVRENFRAYSGDSHEQWIDLEYQAGKTRYSNPIHPLPCAIVNKYLDKGDRWTPSIFMPRWASRITLEVVSVRVERVEDISEEDALAEGTCQPDCPARDCGCNPPYCFGTLWDSINAKRGFSWESNPWVWVVEFKRV